MFQETSGIFFIKSYFMRHLLKTTLILIFASILYSNPIHAQNQVEVGIGTGVTSLLDNFRLIYKKEKKENKWLRLNSSFGNISFSSQNDISLLNFNAGISIGVEKRKQIGNSSVEFLRGPQGILRLNVSGLFDDTSSSNVNIGAGVAYVLGAQVHLKKGVKLGIETQPSLILAWDGDERIDLNLDYSSNALTIFVVYNFEKKKKE